MNLIWLDDFLTLAASGNFSRAAEQRHMTQPAFSRRVRALEDWLGVALFDRSSQPATLTEAGEWFRSVALELRARVARIPDEARAVAEAGAATLRIAATHALSFTFLPGWLRGLEARMAVGPIQLLSDVMQQGEALLLQGRVQFLLCHAHAQVPTRLDVAGCASRAVGVDALMPVSAPDAHGRPRHALESAAAGGARVPWLAYSAESGLGQLLRALRGPLAADGDEARLEDQPLLTTHLASVLKSMALDGRGLAWLPQSLIADELAAARLLPAAAAERTLALEIRLYRAPQALAPAAEQFWRALGEDAGRAVLSPSRPAAA